MLADAPSSSYDYVIVGAGSAGCVLAARLSEDPATRVLLLEAGPSDRSPWIHLPIGYGKTMWSSTYNWRFETEPEPNMHGRRIYWPRGKTLGGSSSINGLIYVRGQPQDYDHWAALGNAGWSYEEVLPYFIKSEGNTRAALGDDGVHGKDGPLKISDIGARHELIEAFIAAAGQIGVPRTEDFNGREQEGAGYYQLTTHRGLRCSAAKAYLRPARHRPNLHVQTHALATQVVVAQGRATGVRWRRDGQQHQALARAEVIVCAGAVQSPQLLQLSGIGAASMLARLGITPVCDLPGVGQNLQDHLQIRLGYECSKPITTNDQLNTWTGRVRLGLEWLLFRRGALAVGINQGACFLRALKDEAGQPVAATPDVQFHVATLSADMAGGQVHPWSGFTLSVCQLRPASRGQVCIRSRDAAQPPAIAPNYLSAELDQRTAVAAVRAARAIAAAPAMRPYVKRERKPGADAQSDAELLDFCRRDGATIFHPSGTCRMGSDAHAVVDARLRVHGVQRLRVVDCSVMPTLVSGNTHAPVVMMAEKAADMIRADARQGL